MPRCPSALAVLCLLACGSAEEPSPTDTTPVAPPSVPEVAMRWPEVPPGLGTEVRQCVEAYRVLADAGLPDHDTGMDFEIWQVGPYNEWVLEYNETRARCDEVMSPLDPHGLDAQILTGAQSSLHERVSVQASVYQSEAQMYLMARYWSLGASCTYNTCASGPNEPWATFCRARAQTLPPCPPPHPEGEPETAPADPEAVPPTE